MIPAALLATLTPRGVPANPLYRQIHDRIAAAVLDGRLPPGARLPSARSLAAQLAIARGTVEAAYQMLAGEGYLVTQGAAGTWVNPSLRCPATSPNPALARADRAKAAIHHAPADAPRPLTMGLPALDAFPRKTWSRLVVRQARALEPASFAYQPATGHGPLREQIARYLAVARGIVCTPEQVLITGGYPGALNLISVCLLKLGDTVWIEDPAYPHGRDALRLAGAEPVGIPVDRHGFAVARALAEAPPARLALVTPTHQFPLGVTLSLGRRGALLAWASAADAWIVEDDYDSEFRYEGKPLPALKSLDRNDRVLFIGTFSKVLAPGARVGYLVVPAGLIDRFAAAAFLLQPPPSTIVQAAIAKFMEQGALARHIRRMRALYAVRRLALAEALRARLGATLAMDLQKGGMHLVARLPPDVNDVVLAARLNRFGRMLPLSACGVAAPYTSGLLIGFTNVDVKDAADTARRFALALTEELASSPSSDPADWHPP